MLVSPISFLNERKNNRYSAINQNKNHTIQTSRFDSISFQRLIPKNANIKIAFFDIDETLKHYGKANDIEQATRNQLFKHVKDNNITSVYSSDRGINQILPLIEDGTLAKPDYIIGNNGGAIFKNVDGNFEEEVEWSKALLTKFNKDTIRNLFAKFGQNTEEYEGHPSPINLRFALAPNFYKENSAEIKKMLNESNMDSVITLTHYPKELMTVEGLKKYFSQEKAEKIVDTFKTKLYDDGSYDSLLISSSDKGMASEFLRKKLGLKNEQVFAAGDGENDFSHANKGYFFALISNAGQGLRNLLNATQKTNVVETTKPGAEGILEALV